MQLVDISHALLSARICLQCLGTIVGLTRLPPCLGHGEWPQAFQPACACRCLHVSQTCAATACHTPKPQGANCSVVGVVANGVGDETITLLLALFLARLQEEVHHHDEWRHRKQELGHHPNDVRGSLWVGLVLA